MKQRETYEEFIKSVGILKSMNQYERNTVVDALEKQYFYEGDEIIREGEEGSRFYLVIKGTAQALKTIDGEQKVVLKYKAGDYFGERALIKDQPRAATIEVTSEKLEVATLTRSCFKRLLGPIIDIMSRNLEVYKTSDRI